MIPCPSVVSNFLAATIVVFFLFCPGLVVALFPASSSCCFFPPPPSFGPGPPIFVRETSFWPLRPPALPRLTEIGSDLRYLLYHCKWGPRGCKFPSLRGFDRKSRSRNEFGDRFFCSFSISRAEVGPSFGHPVLLVLFLRRSLASFFLFTRHGVRWCTFGLLTNNHDFLSDSLALSHPPDFF